uniref:Large ribosomal subunit protein uL24m n=1 Tax=Panagrolaimus superbus TaxID=310955 RepID=A0A914YZ76_9BILA
MLSSKVLYAPKRAYAKLDYAMHMPKSYVERVKRTIPRKIYDNRFGAPPVIRYHLLPEDYVPSTEGRPWEQRILTDALQNENKYHSRLLHNKYHEIKHNAIKKIPDEEWTIFPGDTVMAMVGKHKGKTGIVLKVLKEANAVFVDGLHTKLVTEMEDLERYGLKKMFKWEESALDASKGEVMLVDPQEKEPCTVNWVLNEAKTDWIRVSDKSGVEIPLPNQAKVTYEYISAKDYIEAEKKDTTSDVALKRTYTPRLCLVEQELMDELGIKEDRKPKPTYWY